VFATYWPPSRISLRIGFLGKLLGASVAAAVVFVPLGWSRFFRRRRP
jgi:hypothetical protein